MECLFCGTRLAGLRTFDGAAFCSDDHRFEHLAAKGLPAAGLVPLPYTLKAVAHDYLPVDICALPLQVRPQLPRPELPPSPGPPWRPSFWAQLPEVRPRYLAALLLLLVAFTWSRPASPKHSNAALGVSPLRDPFQFIRTSLRERAAVMLSDDFRTGLTDWESRPKLPPWQFDRNGFVLPAALALYQPSLKLTDYSVEFLGQIEQQGLGLAYRVQDWRNYYAVKLRVVRPGAQPMLAVTRYTVVDGVEVKRSLRLSSVPFQNNSLSQIRLDLHESDFTLISAGHIVDYWADGRYTKGGIGFFCGAGEKARIRWVEIRHQDDALGRFCAFFSKMEYASKRN